MKTLTSFPVVALLFSLWLPACSTLETNTYRTLGVITHTVDAAMNGFGDAVRAGKTTDAQQASVRSLYGQYQNALGIAEKAVSAYRVSSDKTALKQAISTLSAVSAELIAFITEIIQAKG